MLEQRSSCISTNPPVYVLHEKQCSVEINRMLHGKGHIEAPQGTTSTCERPLYERKSHSAQNYDFSATLKITARVPVTQNLPCSRAHLSPCAPRDAWECPATLPPHDRGRGRGSGGGKKSGSGLARAPAVRFTRGTRNNHLSRERLARLGAPVRRRKK